MVDIREKLKGTITCLISYNLKIHPSFVFVVNNMDSDGRVYVFKNIGLLDVDASAPNTTAVQVI